MKRFRLDVPVWATIRIDARNRKEALAILKSTGSEDGCYEITLATEDPGVGIELASAATMWLSPATWPRKFNPRTELEEEADDY